jgi:hypothetical protein
MAHIVAISSGPILNPQGGRPCTRGEVIIDNGVWAVMLPDFPEAFAPKDDMVGFIEKEMTFHLHCPQSSLKKMDKVVVEIRSDSEREIIAPLTDVLIPEKAVWVLSGEAGREVTTRIIEHGHRRSTIVYDSLESREKRLRGGFSGDVFFLIESLMASLGRDDSKVADLAESRR